MRVFLAEGNHEIAANLSCLLRSWGLDVRVACDETTAREIVDQCQPDIMLIDVDLPNKAGFALAKHNPKIHNKSRLRLLATTSRSDSEVSQQIEEAGFEDYFRKPIDLLLLKALMWEAAHAELVLGIR